MNKVTTEVMANLKDMVELRKLLKAYEQENPGVEEWTNPINEYLDAQILEHLTDIIHIERLF